MSVRATRKRFEELRLDGVGRRFGDQRALTGLDLTIRSGEFIALLGPSGCGKTTALNCLAGLLPLSSGRIFQDETRIDTLPPERRGFGMVFQNYALFPHMSVRRNIAFGLRMRRLPKEEVRRRTAEAISLVRLDDHAGKLPGQLSGGQQQRVAIARAVVLEPSLVLMDEPLSNLDAKLRLEMRTEIRRLHQSLGLTTVYVTHDREEALSLADRLVVLRAGRVEQTGTPEELHSRPCNVHVADFMGFRNLLPGRVVSAHGPRVEVEIGASGAAGGGPDAASRPYLTGTAMDQARVGDDVVIGVRPEDLVVGHGGAKSLEAKVEVVEYHGHDNAVSARMADGTAVYLKARERLVPGDAVHLEADPERLLVFPAEPDTAASERAARFGGAARTEPAQAAS